MQCYLTKLDECSGSYFVIFLVLETFQERKKDPLCYVENGLAKRKKWETVGETVAEAQVGDAGGVDQGGGTGKGRQEQTGETSGGWNRGRR